jgi:Rod binding domain-containing protein
MKIDEQCRELSAQGGSGLQPLMIRMIEHDFQTEVLEKLGRLEAKMDMLVGNQQPGRMKLAEDRLATLERNDIRRSVYDRLVNAAITVVISALIALHDHVGLR